ncbi:Gfo/Idh/MocA family oxidoreductase [bacterium]|nr:Gfo/Idh/MocA family oxidoreductase [bacterium]MBU0900270.1 Gfo/Idh/MocA family oxidoreductase [bacterium]MBU1152860.1 Gfo/Idh/MocA family oxidoreductase [bacterium]MBU1782530.1 Gfo/Idh/MocA family oxidoreductase [bacterium]
MEKINVGVIGTGHMGEYHVRTYSEIPNVNLIGVVDPDEERVNKIAKRYNVQAYTNYRKILDQVEAVTIAVPTYLHYEVAKEFLKAKVHVLLEKPMTEDLSQAQELTDLAISKKVILKVGHVERFNAAVGELKNIVTNPIFIECRRLGPYNGRINDTGVVLDLVIHDVDIVLNLVNSPVKNINVAAQSVVSSYEDIANIQMVFENGCIANITASRVTENKIRTLAITQKEAYIYLDYANQDLHIHRQASSKYILSREMLRYKQESFIERLFVHRDNPLKLELKDFIECILTKNQSFEELQDNLKSLEITLEILRKAKLQK